MSNIENEDLENKNSENKIKESVEEDSKIVVEKVLDQNKEEEKLIKEEVVDENNTNAKTVIEGVLNKEETLQKKETEKIVNQEEEKLNKEKTLDDEEDDEPEATAGPKLSAAQKKRLRQKKKKEREKEDAIKASETSSEVKIVEGKEAQPKSQPLAVGTKVLKKFNNTTLPDLPNQTPKPGQVFFQTLPPTIPISELFPKKKYPIGQLLQYRDENTKHYSTNPALVSREAINASTLNDFRQAAECHRQLRTFARSILKPGIKLYDFCTEVENAGRTLLGANSVSHIYGGMAFPTGVSLNNCAAHYTPNPGDDTVLKKSDLIKVDIGTHFHGHIIDSAFTVAFDDAGEPNDHYRRSPAGSIFEPVINASYEATWNTIKEAGIDVRLSDLGALIQETIESYEMEGSPDVSLNAIKKIPSDTITSGSKNVKPLRPVRNLSGHTVIDYVVHGGKSVPLIKAEKNPQKMEEGDVFAIETFASSGKGSVTDIQHCSHYMIHRDVLPSEGFNFLQDPVLTKGEAPPKQKIPTTLLNYSSFPVPCIKTPKAYHLFQHIHAHFRTLAWCNRWVEQSGQSKFALQLKQLVDCGAIDPYPALVDKDGSYVSQHEHTFILKPTGKEILSAGDDYHLD